MKIQVLIVLFLASSLLNASKTTPQGLYLTAKEAYSVMTEKSEPLVFIDVRSQLELEFVGWTPLVDLNIPYKMKEMSNFNSKKHRFSFVPNSDFLLAISEFLEDSGFNKQTKIILMCRSGHRSAKAATLMFEAGYKNVYTVSDGFEGDKKEGKRVANGWKNSNLPWNYNLDEDKMYISF